MALKQYEEAKDMYDHIIKSYNRPDDIHLIYIKMSIVLEHLQEIQEARKMVLLACKYSPTPYTWLAAGLLYYKVNTAQVIIIYTANLGEGLVIVIYV